MKSNSFCCLLKSLILAVKKKIINYLKNCLNFDCWLKIISICMYFCSSLASKPMNLFYQIVHQLVCILRQLMGARNNFETVV